MDVEDLVESFFTDTYAVTRRPRGTFVDGRVVAAASQALEISGCVQPATGRDLMRLEEGRRSNETRVIFTTTELKVGDRGTPFESDLVEITGKMWEIQHVETWSPDPMTSVAYYRCIVQAAT